MRPLGLPCLETDGGWLVGSFSPESNLLPQSNASLRVVALAMLIAIPADIWYTAMVGTGDTAAAFGIELLRTMVMLCLTWFIAIHLAWPMCWSGWRCRSPGWSPSRSPTAGSSPGSGNGLPSEIVEGAARRFTQMRIGKDGMASRRMGIGQGNFPKEAVRLG